jgi:hypothetical protein
MAMTSPQKAAPVFHHLYVQTMHPLEKSRQEKRYQAEALLWTHVPLSAVQGV